MGRYRLPALVLVLICLHVTPADAALWAPAPNDTFQIQFTGTLNLGVNAEVFDVDAFDTPASAVRTLHNRGRRAVCYVNAGAWEGWRPDAGRFPASVLGRPLDGWPGERWLDVRRIGVLAPILRTRMDRCRNKRFDGIEFDNVDGYQNATGFPITRAEQLRFNTWLAREARRHGLAPGLKNALGLARDLVDEYAFAINEQCLVYDECVRLRPFVSAGKPIFHIEYTGAIGDICAASPSAFTTVKKRLRLDAWRQTC